MVNEEILGGLKLALSKGESLKQAMMSFYNSGYIKEEIESAARALQTQQAESVKQIQESSKQIITQKPIKTIQQFKQKPIQKISNYEQQPNNLRGKLITFFLVFTLLFLLGVLAAVFLFKEELMEFFIKLFN